jgi:hypothetical protein
MFVCVVPRVILEFPRFLIWATRLLVRQALFFVRSFVLLPRCSDLLRIGGSVGSPVSDDTFAVLGVVPRFVILFAGFVLDVVGGVICLLPGLPLSFARSIIQWYGEISQGRLQRLWSVVSVWGQKPDRRHACNRFGMLEQAA